MRLLTLRNLIVFDVLLVVLVVVNGPLLLYRSLSSDKEFLPATLVEIQVFRHVVLFVAICVLASIVVWMLSRKRRWRESVVEDFNAYVEQSDSIERGAEDRPFIILWSVILALVFLGLLATIRLSFTFQDKNVAWYDLLALEDGIWETGTAVCLLSGGMLLMAASVANRKALRQPFFALIPFAFGLVLCFAAGEELSWGQRWLGYETPDAAKALNVQGEFTLHNLGGRWANQVMIVFFFLYIGIAPVLAFFFVDVRYILDRLCIPLAPIAFAPYGFVGVLFDEREVFSRIWGHPPWYLDEGRETIFAVAVLGVVLHWDRLWRKRRRGESERVGPARRRD